MFARGQRPVQKVVGRERSPNLGYGWCVDLPLERIRLEPVQAVVSVLCSWARHVTPHPGVKMDISELLEKPEHILLRGE